MPRFTFRRQWILPAVGCILLFLLSFLVALRYVFPYAELAQSAASRLRLVGLEAKFDGLGPGSLLGVRAERVNLAFAGAADRRAELRNVSVRLSLANLLRLRLLAVLEAEAFGGTLHATWPLSGARDVTADWDGVDLRRIPLPPNVSSIGLRGLCNGRASVQGGARPDAVLTGSAQATITDAKFGPGNVNGLPLPAVSLGNGRLLLTMRRGSLSLDPVKFEGGNLEAGLSATIGLAAAYPENPVDGVLSLRPDDRTAADLGFFLSFFPGGRASDGTYTARLVGSLGSLMLSPMTGRR